MTPSSAATYRVVKRLLDPVLGAVGLVLSLPLQAATAAAVAVRLGRPVLFRQVRPGLHGRPFVLVKFRTMHPVDAARGRLDDASRMTGLGRVLRGTSLDELPTLWNVVRGEMSLVGPRPLLPQYLDRYTPQQARRHEVRPGLTGLAQVCGRNGLGWERRFALDVEYVQRCCLSLDVRILFRTVGLVLGREGIAGAGAVTMAEFLGEPGCAVAAPPSRSGPGGRDLKAVLFADLHRLTGRTSWPQFVKQFVLGDAYRYNVALRVTAAASGRSGAAGRAGVLLGRLWLRRLRRRMGINIPWSTDIGPGLLIGHAGGIVVNAAATIGADCNLSHNVTIGVARGNRNPGVPTIGRRVYIGPGAVLIGAITVGDDAAIGANAVVTKDVPAGATARGNPAETIPGKGSGDYVHRTSEPVPAGR